MNLTLLQKIIVILDILLLAALPFIAGWGTFAMPSVQTETKLTEANLTGVAKFKSYEDGKKVSLLQSPLVARVKQENRGTITTAKAPEKQSVLIAGESIGKASVTPTTAPSSTPEPTSTPTQASAVAQTQATVPATLSEAAISFLGNCESGMTATRNSGNGYYGAFQFSISTWNSMNTGFERADLAPLDVQIDAVQRLVARSNIYGQFPACAQKMRSSGLI